MLDARGERNLIGVEPTLAKHHRAAAVLIPFTVTIIDGGGLRTQAQANDNAKRTAGIVDSEHLRGRAVDLLPVRAGEPYWDELAARVILSFLFEVTDASGTAIQNGADWNANGIYGERSEFDWHHNQLPSAKRADECHAAMIRRQAERQTLDIMPSLGVGSTDTAYVRTLQHKLGGLKIDGDFGMGTRRRLAAFQQLAGVEPTGVCYESTWRRLVA